MKLWRIAVAAGIFCLSGNIYAEENGWNGSGCASEESLRSIVDQAFDGEPKVAGISVGLHKPSCGTFHRALGKRDVSNGKEMTIPTKVHIGSLTKPVTTALILRLFGPLVLDVPVGSFFTEDELEQLTSNCSDSFQIQAADRQTGALVPTLGKCPDFSAVTVRQVLNAHDGNISIEELDVNANFLPDLAEYPLGRWFRAVGIPTFPPLASQPTDAFDVLDIFNIYRHNTATIGGNTRNDFPFSFGNTGYGLLGTILERVTELPYTSLAEWFVTAPLGVDPMILLTAVPSAQFENSKTVSRTYFDTTGAGAIPPLEEDTNGVYPVISIRGRPAVDVYGLDSFAMVNSAGGAGALVASTESYLVFFRKLIAGGLLSPSTQEVFDQSFVETGIEIDGSPVAYGFGVFRYQDPGFGGTVFDKGGATLGSLCLAKHADTPEVTAVVCVNQNDLFQGQLGLLVTSVTDDLIMAAIQN